MRKKPTIPKRIFPGVTAARQARFDAKHPELAAKYNPKRKHASLLKRTYGMAYADYQQMYVGQGGRCAICRVPQDRLCVDHCHETNRVRGLLCRKCNSALAFINEDPLAAMAMVRYIESRCVPAKREGPILAQP
jgi:hypothetical protein